MKAIAAIAIFAVALSSPALAQVATVDRAANQKLDALNGRFKDMVQLLGDIEQNTRAAKDAIGNPQSAKPIDISAFTRKLEELKTFTPPFPIRPGQSPADTVKQVREAFYATNNNPDAQERARIGANRSKARQMAAANAYAAAQWAEASLATLNSELQAVANEAASAKTLLADNDQAAKISLILATRQAIQEVLLLHSTRLTAIEAITRDDNLLAPGGTN